MRYGEAEWCEMAARRGRNALYASPTRPLVRIGQDMKMTAILNQIRRLVERLAPAPACGACLAERLDDVGEADAGIALNELTIERGFELNAGDCGLCGERRLVIRKRK